MAVAKFAKQKVLHIVALCVYLYQQNGTKMTTFSAEQIEIIAELAGYVKHKKLPINCKADLDKAFQGFLKANLTHNYFTNEDFKNNFIQHFRGQFIK